MLSVECDIVAFARFAVRASIAEVLKWMQPTSRMFESEASKRNCRASAPIRCAEVVQALSHGRSNAHTVFFSSAGSPVGSASLICFEQRSPSQRRRRCAPRPLFTAALPLHHRTSPRERATGI